MALKKIVGKHIHGGAYQMMAHMCIVFSVLIFAISIAAKWPHILQYCDSDGTGHQPVQVVSSLVELPMDK